MNAGPSQTAAIPSVWRRGMISVARIGRATAATLLVIASLLVFPAGIPAMIAVWLIGYAGLLLAGYRSWPALATCLLVVLVKQIDWPPGMYWLAVAMAVAIALEFRERRRREKPTTRRTQVVLLAFLGLAWLDFAWEWRRACHADHAVAAWDDRPIVCLGDSLTSYPPRGGYPTDLAKLVRAPVVNLGQPGVTSSEALKQLLRLTAARPQAVVIELGGHDFLKDPSWLKADSRRATKRNIEQLIAAARSVEAEVVIVEVPRGFIVDPFAGLERELARQYDLELVSDTAIRNFVLYSRSCPPGMWTDGPFLSDDGLHPNARGEAYLASVVRDALVRLFGSGIKTDLP